MENVTLLDLSLWDYGVIFGASLIASFVAGVGGFGGGFVVVIALTPIVGARAVVPLIAVFAFFSNLSRLFFYFKHIQWKLALQFILASIPGVWVGAEIFVRLPDRPLLAVLGLTLIAVVPLRRYLKKHNFEPGLKTIIFVGIVFGIVSGTAVGSGLFVIAGLSSAGLTGMALLGTDAIIGIINAFSRASAFYLHGALPIELIVCGTLMSVGTAPGTWLASRMVTRMGTKNHSYLIEALIIVGGGMFLYNAAFGATP